MPEFVLDYGSPEAAKRFRDASAFMQGYIEAMYFTETGTGDDEELEHATLADLDESAWHTIARECDAFLSSLPKDHHERTAVDLACDYSPEPYDETAAGRDFWYTRNGHGTGCWARGLGAVGDQLDEAAKRTGSRYIYMGDDGNVYYEHF